MEVHHICKSIIFCFILTSYHYQVISTTANNTTETKIVYSQLDLNNAVNEQVPTKTAMSLEIKDQYYDVTKWLSFAGCGFWSFSRYYTQTEAEQRLRLYFNDELVRAEDTYDCSLKCSLMTSEKFFSFVKGLCQCIGITSSDVNKDNRNCLGRCDHVSDVYCNGEHGLPIFEKHNVTQARLTRFDGRLPRLDSLYFGRCFVEENGVYNNHRASVLVRKIKSNTTCNKFNVIFYLSSGRFIQWICEENLKYFRIIFLSLGRTTENALTIDREDDLQVTTISIHDKVSDLENVITVDGEDHLPRTNMLKCDRVNAVLFKVTVGAAAVFGIVVIVLVGVICYLRKKLTLASYTNMTIDRVEGAYTVLPRTYMEITTLSMSGRDNYEQNVNSDVRQNAHMEHSLPSSELHSAETGHYESVH